MLEKTMESVFQSFSEILPHLFLAGYGCVTESKLKQHGITHAVDATNLRSKKFGGIEYFEAAVDDSVIAKIDKYFDSVADFVQQAASTGGKTVIYCAAGVSRSATLVIMYLVLKEKMTLRDAYYTVNQIRPIISPNVGFWRQMIDAEKSVNGSSTVTLITGRTPRPIPDVYIHRNVASTA